MPTKNALLEWFGAEPRMREWDIIVALARDDLNRLIEQVFIEQFNATSFGQPFTARLDYELTERYLQDFILGPPRLSFDDTGLNDSRANLSMAVVGGSDIVLQHGVQWEVSRLEWIQPMQGPVLRMVVALHDTPGSIEVDGSLNLDLKNANNFILDFRGEPNLQRLGGEVFEALFKKMPDSDKVFNLGKFVNNDPYFTPLHLFWLRTQANHDPGRAGEGAVLVFMSTDKNFGGKPPGENHDFRFLIPNDLPACSASVLFQPNYVAFPIFFQSVLSLLDSYDLPIVDGFTWTIPNAHMTIERGDIQNHDVRDLYEKLRAAAGVLKDDKVAEFISKGKGLTLTYLPDDAELEMDWECIFEIPTDPISMKQGFVLNNRYRMIFEKDKLEFKLVSSDAQYDPITAGLQGGLIELIMLIIAKFVDIAWRGVLDIMLASMTDSLNKLVLEGGGGLLRNIVQLRFGNTLIGGEGHSRHEIITFNTLGKIDGIPDVQPRWPNVPVGGQAQFKVANASGPISWHVEALDAGQMPVGSIDATGRYTVPADARLSGFVRERVCATQGEVPGYTMVTIAHDALSIAPLVQVLSPRGSMLLDAGSSDASPTFQWTIDGQPVQGNPTAAQIQFTAAEPDRGYPTFTRVQVSVGTVAREACVITLAQQPALTLKVRIDEVDAGKGEVSLRMTIPVEPGKRVTWKIEFGGGTVSALDEDQAKALFRVGQATTERVAVVQVSVATPDAAPTGVGFIVLPLPLYEYPTIYSKLMLPD